MRCTVVAAALVAAGCEVPASSSSTGDGSDTFSTSTWDAGWADFEDQVLELVNDERASGGTCGGTPFRASGPLETDATLRGLARDYSRWMADDGFFDHVDPNGEDPFDRMADAGFDGAQPWGENIAAGYPTPQEVVDGWMASPGHCSNILEPSYAVTGIGYDLREDDPEGLKSYWTQEFAASH